MIRWGLVRQPVEQIDVAGIGQLTKGRESGAATEVEVGVRRNSRFVAEGLRSDSERPLVG